MSLQVKKDSGIILVLLILPAAVLIGPLIVALFAAFMSSMSIPHF